MLKRTGVLPGSQSCLGTTFPKCLPRALPSRRGPASGPAPVPSTSTVNIPSSRAALCPLGRRLPAGRAANSKTALAAAAAQEPALGAPDSTDDVVSETRMQAEEDGCSDEGTCLLARELGMLIFKCYNIHQAAT